LTGRQRPAAAAAEPDVQLTMTDAACCAESISDNQSTSSGSQLVNGELYQLVPGR